MRKYIDWVEWRNVSEHLLEALNELSKSQEELLGIGFDNNDIEFIGVTMQQILQLIQFGNRYPKE